MADTCTLCIDGCQQTPEGLCPLHWQRNASGHCTESWNCLQYSNTINRVFGALFLFVALIYVRIMYYRSLHSEDPQPHASAVERPSCSSSSPLAMLKYVCKLFASFIQRYPPQNFARCLTHRPHASHGPCCNCCSCRGFTPGPSDRFLMLTSVIIRGLDLVLLFRHTANAETSCPRCFPR